MIRCVVLASGSGTKLQSLLDSIFFGEIPDMEIVAVISSDPEANALTRARNAHIEAVDMHREVFPNESTFDLAVRNKIRDLDADLVIDAGFHPGVGPETAKAFRNKIIAVQPSLVPAFQDLRGLAVHEAVLARGLKLTGATAYLVDEQGGIGPVLLQKAVEVGEDDDAVKLQRRVLRQAARRVQRTSAATTLIRFFMPIIISFFSARAFPVRHRASVAKVLIRFAESDTDPRRGGC